MHQNVYVKVLTARSTEEADDRTNPREDAGRRLPRTARLPTRGGRGARSASPGEALIRVEAVGICASDLKCYHGAAKFWGDENRPAWAETMVIPGHEFAGRVVELDDEAARRWGIARGRPRGLRADRPVLGMPLLQAREYHMCQPHDLYGFKRRTPGGMASYMVYPADALVYKISGDIPAAPCGVRRAAVLLAARGRARADHLRGHGRGRPAAARSGSAWSRAPAAKNPTHVIALDMAPDKLKLAAGCGADITINIAEQDAVDDHQGADRRLRRRRLPRGHRPSVGGSPGPQPVTQARPLRRVRRLRQRRLRRLEHHQRRQGTRRPRGPSRPVLLARRRSR